MSSAIQLCRVPVHATGDVMIISETENEAKSNFTMIINQMTDPGWLMNAEKTWDLA